MADLAFGISKTVVAALVNKVKVAIRKDAELLVTVQSDVLFITGEFEMMQSFLNVADSESIKNDVARTWVRQVRDLSYDAEDSIEFIIHLDMPKSWWSWRSWLPRLLSSCKVIPPLDLDKAAAEIKEIKARVEHVSQRNIRYSLIGGDSGSQPVQHVQQKSAANTNVMDIINGRDATKDRVAVGCLYSLVSTDGLDLQVTSVCGTGGDLGVLSIIRKTYDYLTSSSGFGRWAWVRLMNPFNPHDFIQSILAQFSREEPGATNIVEHFEKQVNTQKYLIVVEGLSTMAQWDATRRYLRPNDNGSRIIVSTHNLEIASLCTGQPSAKTVLRVFSADHSILAFNKKPICNDDYGGRSSNRIASKENASSWLDNNVIIGRDSEVRKLIELITSERVGNQTRVIAVRGIAGVGKSILVKTVYYTCIRDTDKFNNYAWFHASHPINHMDFAQSIVSDFENSRPSELENLFENCKGRLRDNPYLLVIDGLEFKEDWDTIKASFISTDSPSCIIVVTREESVARHCMTEPAVFHVKCLEAEAALRLFKKEATKVPGTSDDLDHCIENHAELTINKCGRLSTVAVAMGLCVAKRWDMKLLISNFMHKLEIRNELSDLEQVFNWMHYSFQTCPQILKKCIFYLLIFPQSCPTIQRMRLVRRWIAEGFSEGTDSNSLLEYTEKLIDKLADMGIIGKPSETSTRMEVNSLFLEYITLKETKERIFVPLEVSVLEGECCLKTQRVGQHLAIRKNWKRDKFAFGCLDFMRLRSLTVSGEWVPFFISDKMKVLRVLDLEGTSNVEDQDVKEIVDVLDSLKFLSLRGCRKIFSLPDSLGKLRQLQTLDIRGTCVVKLPQSIVKLHKLQCIRAGTARWDWNGTDHSLSSAPLQPNGGFVELPTPSPAVMLPTPACPLASVVCSNSHLSRVFLGTRNRGVKDPAGIENLTALQTIGVVNVNAAGGKANLEKLKALTQLRKFQVSGINRANSIHLSSASQLECLSLHPQKDNQALHMDGVQLPPNLRNLKLYGHVEKLPGSIKDLHNLMKLSLKLITSNQADIEVIGKLPKLHTLRIQVGEVEDAELKFRSRIDDSDQSSSRLFLNLKVLEIACTNYPHVTFVREAMERLEMLAIRCNHSSLRLYGLKHLASLHEVILRDSHSNKPMEELQQQLSNHPLKPALKLEQHNSSSLPHLVTMLGSRF